MDIGEARLSEYGVVPWLLYFRESQESVFCSLWSVHSRSVMLQYQTVRKRNSGPMDRVKHGGLVCFLIGFREAADAISFLGMVFSC